MLKHCKTNVMTFSLIFISYEKICDNKIYISVKYISLIVKKNKMMGYLLIIVSFCRI